MNIVDQLIGEFDKGLRTVFAPAHSTRSSPAPMNRSENLSQAEKQQSIRLMRINHCGEVCAQALYQGQASVARDDKIKAVLQHAADEERDHLAWCEKRLNELGGHKTIFNPLWYLGSYGLGVASGLLGDRWSMGFLVETEKQVEAHLHEHLAQISNADTASREVLQAMKEDEIRHGQSGVNHGAADLPKPIKLAMQATSKLMTRTAYWV